ncbi:MAG: M20/M25/M40 family metallo-hydrolase [Gemmatimonadota bacterium]
MRTLTILCLAALCACSGPALQRSAVQPVAAATDAGAATITAGDMKARIAFLASDALRGRDTPSPGLEAAAAYIASEFQRLGLQPRGDEGTYYQRYPFTVRRLIGDSTSLTVTTRGEAVSYTFGSDLFAWAGTPVRASGDLYFVDTPRPENSERVTTDPPGGHVRIVYVGGAPDRAWRTAVLSARNAARREGANALIVVLDPSISEADVKARAAAFSVTRSVAPVVSTVFLRNDRARELFRRAGHDLAALVARAQAGTIEPVRLQATVAQIAAPVQEDVYRPPNVVAVLPGSDPELRDTYLVLSAHMDHVGVDRPDATGDSIYNGADDDASGTSAVIEVAEALASLPQRPARSVMFLLVSGEEKGLLGSQYFADHPTVPLSSIIANINIDMIGRNAPDTVVAIGQEYSSLGPLALEIARSHPELGLTASRDIWPNERFFFRSDHYNFARKEIPAIFFFSGVHEDYHRPSDEVEKIDGDKAARIARFAYYLAHEVASRREPPKWTQEGLNAVRAMTR